MIILISALNANFDAPMSSRCGRAPWFIRFTTETGNWEAVENTGSDQPGGAGVATTQLLIDQGAEADIKAIKTVPGVKDQQVTVVDYVSADKLNAIIRSLPLSTNNTL